MRSGDVSFKSAGARNGFQGIFKIDAIMGEEMEETGDCEVDEKDKVVNLTEQAWKRRVNILHW